MTKYQLDFNMDLTSIFINKEGNTYRMNNFFVEGQSELLKLGLLPPVVRSISPSLKITSDDRHYIILVERKPQAFVLSLMDGEILSPFLLPTPWQHYFIVIKESEGKYTIDGVRMYYSSTSLTSLDHIFYEPYHPTVDEHDITDFSTSNLSFFNYWGPNLDPYSFNILFNEIQNIIWNDWDFNPKGMKSVHDFVEAYGFKLEPDYDETSYAHAVEDLKRIESIPVNQILDEKTFKALIPALTFGDYLKYLISVTDEGSFDFKTAFKKAFDAAEIVKIPPSSLLGKKEYKITKKPYKVNIGGSSLLLNQPIYQQPSGTTMTGNIIVEPTYQYVNTSSGYTSGGYGNTSGTVTWNTSSTLNAAWDTMMQTSTPIVPPPHLKLYKDSKNRWRRPDGTFASKKEIHEMIYPWAVVEYTL